MIDKKLDQGEAIGDAISHQGIEDAFGCPDLFGRSPIIVDDKKLIAPGKSGFGGR